MRITKEYVFDMIEMVGKAVANARAKSDKAGPEWDFWGSVESMVRRWMDEKDPIARKIKAAAEAEDDRWNLETGWKDSAQDSVDGQVAEPQYRETYSEYGSEKFEQRTAKREYKEFGDTVSCRLWKIQRELSFGDSGVHDALKDLIRLCEWMGGLNYISKGWANRLLVILHAHSRG
jgi:hypothetical protein